MERCEYKRIEVPSAGTGMDLLNIPDEIIFSSLKEQTDSMVSTASNWIKRRPLLDSGLDTSDGLNKVRKELQVLTPWQREREFMTLAQGEAIEFLAAVRGKQPISEIKLELGDILFNLLVSDDAILLNGEYLEDVGDYKEASFRSLLPEIQSVLNGCTAEEALVVSVGIINQVAGLSDGSRLQDINTVLADAPDNVFDELLFNNSILNSFDLTFDLAFRYASLMGWNLSEIIKQTARKNNNNMPEEFFGPFAPFTSVSDTLSCLKLFRKYTFTKENGSFKKQFSQKYRDMLKMWPIHPLGYEFRLWIASLIDDVVNNENISLTDRGLAKLLAERNLIEESPLWNVPKHSFKPVSLDSRYFFKKTR